MNRSNILAWAICALLANLITILMIYFSILPWMWPDEFRIWISNFNYGLSQLSLYLLWVLVLATGLKGISSKTFKYKLIGYFRLSILLIIFLLNFNCLYKGECYSDSLHSAWTVVLPK